MVAPGAFSHPEDGMRNARYTPKEKAWIIEAYVLSGGSVKAVHEAHQGEGWPARTYRAIETVILKDPDVAGPIAARQNETIAQAKRLEAGGFKVTEKGDGTLEVKGPPRKEGVSWESLVEGVGLNPDDFELVKLSLNINPDGLTQSWVIVKPRRTTTGMVEAMEESFLRRVTDGSIGGRSVSVLSRHDLFRLDGRRLLVLAVPDLHLGKLAWGRETGENWDLQIAERAYRDAVANILVRAHAIGFHEIEIPVGHDFFHIDGFVDGKVPTTFNGTPQDVDGRWQKAWDLGSDLLVWTIERALEVSERVTVKQVSGNHDKTKAYMFCRLLEAYFRNEGRVEFDIGPDPRKFTRWGNVGLMHTHGSDEKPQNLANLFQIEAPKTWGETLFREILMGHLHKKREWMDEEGGVVYNRLSSLSGADAWHHEQGWKGAVRSARGIIYCSHEGRIADVHHNIVPSLQARSRKEPEDRAA